MKVGDYVRTKNGIEKIKIIEKDFLEKGNTFIATDNDLWRGAYNGKYNGFTIRSGIIIKSSPNIIDLIEYMDLLELECPIKLYGSDNTISLFNPVRCDGFTTFEDGTNCIILNLDYIVDVKDLKIKSILTHEQFKSMEYKVGE